MSTSEPDAMDFDLIPPDPGLISPDLALDAALAPVVDVDPEAEIPLGRGWRFDFLAGQFVKDGARPQVTYELDTLITWVEKTCRTARYAHPIYSDGYGVDGGEIIGFQINDELLTGYQEAIADALIAHDRIVAVEDFSFNQDPFDEALYASFTVVLDATPPFEAQPIEFTQIPVQ